MQLANIFTKPLGEDQFYFIRRELVMIDYADLLKPFIILCSLEKISFKAAKFNSLDSLKVIDAKSFEYQFGKLLSLIHI